MITRNAIFMVEGGQALQLVKQHIADRMRVQAEVAALARELGVSSGPICRTSGKLLGVVFNGASHPDFKKANRQGVSYPKRGTAWAQRLQAQAGYPNPETVISEAFGVPLQLNYRTDVGSGSSCIGNFLCACGWLYVSPDGPYGMWVPDVPAYVAERQANSAVVEEPARSFKLEFEGCRRIEPEEWDILVAQEKLREKASAKEKR